MILILILISEPTTADPREIHREVLGPETRPQQAEKGLRGREGKTLIVHYSF